MTFSARQRASAVTIAISAVGLATLAAPAAQASNSVLWRATSYIWTDSNAQSECTAMGKQEVASGDWDAYKCLSDSAVSPTAIQLWVGIWVGCPTCVKHDG